MIMYGSFYAMYDNNAHIAYVADENQNIIKSYNTYNRNVSYENLRNYINIALIESGRDSIKDKQYYIIEPASPDTPSGYQEDNSIVQDFYTIGYDVHYLS